MLARIARAARGSQIVPIVRSTAGDRYDVIHGSGWLTTVRTNIAAQYAKILGCRIIHRHSRATDQLTGGLFVPIQDAVTAFVLKHRLPVVDSIATGIQLAVVALGPNTRLLI